MTKRSTTAQAAPQVAAGPAVEEFATDFHTIQLILRMTRKPQGSEAVIRHFIASDQSPVEVVASLAAYYQMAETLAAPRSLKMLLEAGKDSDYAFVFFTPENCQVVMEMDTWAGLCALNGSSMLMATDFLNENVAQLLANMDEFTPLTRIDFDLSEPEPTEG